MAVATRLNVVTLLLTSIQKHTKEAKVVRNACMTLATIVEEDGWWNVSFSHSVLNCHVLMNSTRRGFHQYTFILKFTERMKRFCHLRALRAN